MGRFFIWACRDLRSDWSQLEAAKVMGGLLIYPVFLGVAYELFRWLGLQH